MVKKLKFNIKDRNYKSNLSLWFFSNLYVFTLYYGIILNSQIDIYSINYLILLTMLLLGIMGNIVGFIMTIKISFDILFDSINYLRSYLKYNFRLKKMEEDKLKEKYNSLD